MVSMTERMDTIERQFVPLTKAFEPLICSVRVLRLAVVLCKEPVRFYPPVAPFESLVVLILAQLFENIHYLLWEFKAPL